MQIRASLDLQFKVTLLPVEPVGAEALKPFGYDLFEEAPTTFALATDIPVPCGLSSSDLATTSPSSCSARRRAATDSSSNRDGALTLPEFGPIQVTGLSFDDVRERNRAARRGPDDRRARERHDGSAALAARLRRRRRRPTRLVHASAACRRSRTRLFASGGVAEIGSLRNIELKRGGATFARFDLYDLLLQGDTSRDLPLQQGDAIFVPPIGGTAGVAGEVRRPAIYEFRDGATVGELAATGGRSEARMPTHGAAKLERIDASRRTRRARPRRRSHRPVARVALRRRAARSARCSMTRRRRDARRSRASPWPVRLAPAACG